MPQRVSIRAIVIVYDNFKLYTMNKSGILTINDWMEGKPFHCNRFFEKYDNFCKCFIASNYLRTIIR